MKHVSIVLKKYIETNLENKNRGKYFFSKYFELDFYCEKLNKKL